MIEDFAIRPKEIKLIKEYKENEDYGHVFHTRNKNKNIIEKTKMRRDIMEYF